MNDTPTMAHGAGGTGSGGGDGRGGRASGDESADSAIGLGDGSNHRVDPVTASVIQGALENIATEMGHKLMRMSYSSIIRESEDFGAGLVDPGRARDSPSRPSPPLSSPDPFRATCRECSAR